MSDPANPIPAVSTADPEVSGRSKKWLNLSLLQDHIDALEIPQTIDKFMREEFQRRGKSCHKEERMIEQRKRELTVLYTIRAVHRGRRHVQRHRVFGPGHPNGTAIVEGPITIPSAILMRYLLTPIQRPEPVEPPAATYDPAL